MVHDNPEQHALELVHDWPEARQTGATPHTPPLHERPEQQPAEPEQLCPDAPHVELVTHRPVVALHDSPAQHAPPNAPLQSSPLVEQLPPPVPPMH